MKCLITIIMYKTFFDTFLRTILPAAFNCCLENELYGLTLVGPTLIRHEPSRMCFIITTTNDVPKKLKSFANLCNLITI